LNWAPLLVVGLCAQRIPLFVFSTVSGGQKQRIAIARAVYAKRDVVLLDDPLSAVDVHVSQRIWTDVITGLLRRSGATVILATHHVRYLAECDRVLFMDAGVCVGPSPKDELATLSPAFLRFVTRDPSAEMGDEASAANAGVEVSAIAKTTAPSQINASRPAMHTVKARTLTPDVAKVKADPTALETTAANTGGGVQWASLRTFMKAMGGRTVAVAVFSLFPITMGARNFTDWWVGNWIQQGDGESEAGNIGDNPDKNFYLGVYGGSALLFCGLVYLKGMVYVGRMLAGSSTLHTKLVAQILR
jgi:ATP-binding cassette subfamily C (CFTR/MRP) protein 5